MKINSLSIKNFRCFNEYQITLASRMTILIGKNGAGKILEYIDGIRLVLQLLPLKKAQIAVLARAEPGLFFLERAIFFKR